MHHLGEEGEHKTGPSGPHVKAQQHYYEMRRRHVLAQRKATEAYRAMKEAEHALVEIMMDMGLSKLDYMEDGSKITFRGGLSVSVTQENEEVVRSWLRREYGDDLPFETVRLDKSEITNRIKQDIEAGELSETEVPAEMKLKQFPSLVVNGWQDI